MTWGQGPGLELPCAHRSRPQRAVGTRSPLGTETEPEHRQGVGKQECTLDLEHEFYFYVPSLLRSLQSRAGTGHYPQEGVGSDRIQDRKSEMDT